MVVHCALIHYLLEDQHILELEEDPSSLDLVGYALYHRDHCLKQDWVLLVVPVLHYHQILRNDGVVDEDGNFRYKVDSYSYPN